MDGKIRFDLKQISAWDKQNENDMKKKSVEASKPKGKSSFFKKDPNAEEGDGTGFDHGYRDRALERRKQTPAEDAQMEEIVSKLDAEQTKFLGGDMEHTHLVKGLDYALLEKVRRQKEKEDALNASASASKAQSDVVPLQQIQPSSQIGTSMLRFLTKQQSQTQMMPTSSKGSQNAGLSVAGSILQRTVFEFDSLPLSEVDVPLMVTRSRKEFTTNEEYVNFVMNTDHFTQLCGLMETGKLLSAKQKKKRALKETHDVPTSSVSASVTTTTSSATKSTTVASAPIMSRIVDDDDIYGDDLVVGKYVPAGLDEAEPVIDNTQPNHSTCAIDHTATSSSVKNIFAQPPTTTPASTNNDLMKPIRELLGAQQAKEQALKQRQQAHIQTQLHGPATSSNTGKSMVVETDSSGKLLVHRDVFATTKDKVVQGGANASGSGKLGEVFGLHGGYDLFPETTGSYEQYDSDDAEGAEGVGDEPAAKKHKTNSSSSGGGAGSAPSAKSSGTSGGGGGGGGGANRAARRAGAAK